MRAQAFSPANAEKRVSGTPTGRKRARLAHWLVRKTGTQATV